jgi:hypothetical protein
MAEAAHSISAKPAAVAEFNWEDPLDLESQLTEEEADDPRQCARLSPRTS